MADGIHITPEIADAVNGALDAMSPIVVTYVDAKGVPHISFRGTVQTYGEDQLALWARDANGGLPSALPSNPNLAMLYRNAETRTMYIFTGRGHVDNAEDVRKKVFESSHEREQGQDPERKGVAIIVDLDVIQGRGADGPFKLERA